MKQAINFAMRARILAAAFAFTATGAAAFPEKAIKLVVPYAPGGSTDIVARTAARLLEAEFKSPVLVENRPGANTIVAAQYVANSKPDGYTLMVAGTASTNINSLLYKNLAYNMDADFVPVGMLSRMPYAMLVNAALPAKTPSEFARYALSERNKVSYATAGNGNPMHLAAAMFQNSSKAEMVQIPYQGSAPSLAALAAGDVQLSFDVLGTAMPFVEAGKIRVLAVTALERNPKLPDVPTMNESGFPGYEVDTGFAIVAPSRTPAAVLARLHAGLAAALATPAFKDALAAQTLSAYPAMSIAESQALLVRERARWKAVIERNAITLDK